MNYYNLNFFFNKCQSCSCVLLLVIVYNCNNFCSNKFFNWDNCGNTFQSSALAMVEQDGHSFCNVDSKMFFTIGRLLFHFNHNFVAKANSNSPILGDHFSYNNREYIHHIDVTNKWACDTFVGMGLLTFVCRQGNYKPCRIEFFKLRFSRIIPCGLFPTLPLRLKKVAFLSKVEFPYRNKGEWDPSRVLC